MRDWLMNRALEARVLDISAFPVGEFELIINAIGDGAPGRIKAAGTGILETTEYFDRICLDYLDRNPNCAYVFLSTGRVYGDDYERAQRPDPHPLELARFTDAQFYPLAKRKAELRHRDLTRKHIADIRIFGYLSDEINLHDDFLVSQILRTIIDDDVFVTTPSDFVRDYIGPDDLIELIARLLEAGVPNNEYDICSAGPTTKFEMLETLAKNFGLRYTIDGTPVPTTRRDTISLQTAARRIGHIPSRASLENVLSTADAIRRRPARPDRRRAL